MNDFLTTNEHLEQTLKDTLEKIQASDAGVEGAVMDKKTRLYFCENVLTLLQANAKLDKNPESPIVKKIYRTAHEIFKPVQVIDGPYSVEEKEDYLKLLQDSKAYFSQPDINSFARQSMSRLTASLALSTVMQKKYCY